MTSLRSLRLPRVALQVDAATIRQVHAATLARCSELGVVGSARMTRERFEQGAFALLTLLTYPDANRDSLVTCNDFMTYLFFVDDQAEEDIELGQAPERLARYFRHHLTILRGEGRATPDDPAGRLLASLRERLVVRMSNAWLERFARDVEAYLLRGTLVGARHWTAHTVPSVDAYGEQRLWDSAMLCTQDLLEAAGAGELDARLATCPTLHTLRRLCARVVAFTNDLVSYGKEVREHASPNNLVHVLMHHEHRPLADAIARVVAVIEGDAARFEQCAADAPESLRARPEFARYLRGQRAWMYGNLVWSLASGRYSHDQALFPELLPPRCAAPSALSKHVTA